MAHVNQKKLYFMLQKEMRMRKKMTKRFHKCDDTCKVNHKPKASSPKIITKIIEKKIRKPPVNSPISNKEIKPNVVNVYKLAPKTNSIIEIINIVDEIDNENETNKVLEKTLITLRKLQQDIAN